jgi:hypothetical protein
MLSGPPLLAAAYAIRSTENGVSSYRGSAARRLHGHLSRRIFMRRLLTEGEKAEIIEREWAKARAKNSKVVMRVTVQDETDEGGKPRYVVIAF